jgi:ATP-dependent DNA helicase RecQ
MAKWLNFVKDLGNPISLFVVDEFHGLEDYADFRPSYAQLTCLRTFRPSVPFMLLSGTVTETLKVLSMRSLGLRSPVIIEDAIDRPLLFWRLRDSTAHLDAATLTTIDAVVGQPEGTVMIFSKTITEAMTNWKVLSSIHTASTELYHSRSTSHKKDDIIKKAMSGTCRIICCTSALGAVSGLLFE